MKPYRFFALILVYLLGCTILLSLFVTWAGGKHWLLHATGLVVGSAIMCGGIMMLFVRWLKPLRRLGQRSEEFLKKQDDWKEIRSTSDRTSNWQLIEIGLDRMLQQIAGDGRQLSDNVDQLNAVLAGMNEGVLAIDGQRRIVLCNQSSCELLAITSPDLIGRKLFEVCRLPQLQQLVQSSEISNQSGFAEFETAGAPRKIVTVRAAPLGRKNGIGLVLVVHDVTELRQLETMRRDFFTNVSHELKTPLSSIKAYAETLRLGAINDKKMSLEFVKQIESAADRLSEQIRDLLHLSRVESGHAEFELEPVSLSSACLSCVERFRSAAEFANIELVFCESNAGGVTGIADKEGLGTILDNLVSNALRYTSETGRVTLSISRDDPWSVISVSDTGIGIPKDKQERVFERFYRVDKSRSREVGGTGLGLSIVKHLSNSFGGKVELESSPGRGSVFRIKLRKTGSGSSSS